MRSSPVTLTIDAEKRGVQHGFMKMPHSHDWSAWGAMLIPVTVINNGTGPTALLTGGNHGDEYEGPVALFDLARTLQASEISGRVIIVPAMNYPAFRAGRRTSPIDQGNMNRSFPGNPQGGVTAKIADFFSRVLLPQADIVVDFHSGGRTLDLLPFAAVHILADKAQQARCVEAVNAFCAPYSMRMLELDPAGMYDTAVEEAGKTLVTTELRGGGTATARSVAVAKRGVRNVLKHAGILSGEIERTETVWLSMETEQSFITSEHAGLVEPHCDLGDPVDVGDPIVSIYPIDRCGEAPVIYRSQLKGVLAGRHFPGLAAMGDNLAVIATIV